MIAVMLILLLFSMTGCGKTNVKELAGTESDEAAQVSEAADANDAFEANESNASPQSGEQSQSTISQETPDTDCIYSYLQGIKSYEKGKEWTGAWCYEEAAGQQFSAFGCGICCLSNMYSTFSGKAYDPGEMYVYAKEHSSYAPDSGIGAIGWSDIVSLTEQMGCSVSLQTMGDYESFCQQVGQAQTTMVLVSSDNDDTIWKDLPGHYVNIWCYNANTDEVFMTDSKGPSRNRTWVALSDIYKALKTSSEYQYMTVNSYDANQDVINR